MKIIELKNKFTELRFINKPFTTEIIEEIRQEFENLFIYFDLEDLQWRLTGNPETGIISFTPIRKIDELAVRGIISL